MRTYISSDDLNSEGFDFGNLPEDFLEEAEWLADCEDAIAEAMEHLGAAGDFEDLEIGGYLFTRRSQAKLHLHGLIIDDAIEVLVQNSYDVKNGSDIATGDCRKGHAEIVFTGNMPQGYAGAAKYAVITGYTK